MNYVNFKKLKDYYFKCFMPSDKGLFKAINIKSNPYVSFHKVGLKAFLLCLGVAHCLFL